MAARGEDEFLNLRRVLVAEPQTGEAIRILAVEVYDDGFAIRWAVPSRPEPMSASPEAAAVNPSGLMSLTLRDDIGTRYYYAGMLGGTIPVAAGGGITFYTPTIPDEASWLEVFVREGSVRFELQATE
jgi:hypothetical protein